MTVDGGITCGKQGASPEGADEAYPNSGAPTSKLANVGRAVEEEPEEDNEGSVPI